jgi:orotidine-5'-phosphate decarboxylase
LRLGPTTLEFAPAQPMRDARERLIVALDLSSSAEAHRIVSTLGESVHTFKVGNQLFTAEGPQAVRDLIAANRKVFLDLKYHDIPNTVGAAVREAAKLGVSMLTVHASGGGKMLRAAVDAARDINPAIKVLGVTVLTSLTDYDLEKMGVRGRVEDQVLRLAAMAIASGCQGIVASAHEASALRNELGHEFVIVTPGVRPPGTGHGDQARVVTPEEAIASGATHIVVGRPITEAADPAAEARAILGQIQG